MEALAGPRVLDEHRRHREAIGKTGVQLLEPVDDHVRTDRIYIAEWPATKRRKPDPEDRSDVAVASRAEDSFLETHRRLVHHREHAPLDDLGCRDLSAVCSTDDRIDRFIDLPLLAFVVVKIEAALPFSPFATGLDNAPKRFGRRHARPERLAQHATNVAADV